MTVWVYVPIVLSAALALLAGPIAARSAPAAGALALAGAALTAAVTSTASLILLVATLIDDLPPPLVARNEPGRPQLPQPVPDVIAITAIVLLMIALVRCGTDVRRRGEVHRRLREAGRPGEGGVVIADWAAPYAVAVPGRPGHVLLTTGLIRLLTPAERRVVLAHEQSHLSRRHHRITAAAAVAAALNPLLIPVRDAVSYLVERWADEDAAAAVGDRHLTARSVAKAALATLDRPAGAPDSSPGRGSGVNGMHGARQSHALSRVRAMTTPAPRANRAGLIALGLLSLAFIVTDAAATSDFITFAAAWLP
ncbi:M56 family metallopeptidase [Catenuloplanes japonicus]|uniref:M56 family metallopeptidase n=1 Tax=Catenuloplanes japonicus TaxID=33876 RepID=UPI0005258351|nr:M56 family metallopeptidase [Catenuloplanes japonicus]